MISRPEPIGLSPRRLRYPRKRRSADWPGRLGSEVEARVRDADYVVIGRSASAAGSSRFVASAQLAAEPAFERLAGLCTRLEQIEPSPTGRAEAAPFSNERRVAETNDRGRFDRASECSHSASKAWARRFTRSRRRREGEGARPEPELGVGPFRRAGSRVTKADATRSAVGAGVPTAPAIVAVPPPDPGGYQLVGEHQPKLAEGRVSSGVSPSTQRLVPSFGE